LLERMPDALRRGLLERGMHPFCPAAGTQAVMWGGCDLS
jgi:hypothetical protein